MPEARISEKRWNKDMEKEIVDKWKKDGKYQFNESSDKPVYSIDTPPPYVNRPIHIGQATTYVLMDMFARFRRMLGYNVLFPLGLDRNGLPIEMEAERKFKVKLTDLSREEFIELCKKVLEESSLASTDSFKRLGVGFNSYEKGDRIGEVYLTDSPEYRALTQATFIDLWKKGLIFSDNRINNFCPGCQTTIADSEIEYAELGSLFSDIAFKCKETGEELVIGTTRPELVCTCGMVIFNPEDERYKHLEGKTAVSPLFDKEIPIKGHSMADKEKGTGLVMMCSAGDTSDVRFFREQHLEPVIAIEKNGKMNSNAGFLEGLKVADARAEMLRRLESEGLVREQKKINHRTPICERSKDPIEFIAMEELYLKQVDFKEKMQMLGDEMTFFADQSKHIFKDWVDSVSMDWPISRRRYYATEIPLWYCKACEEPIVPEKGKYYQPWKEDPPVKKCPKCGGEKFEGEKRVFDTWFDSSISPLYILKWNNPDYADFFHKNQRCSVRPQGKEIVRTWLYYTVLKCYQLTGKCIFKDVWVNYHILDSKGKKMSKSLGNVIDPVEVMDKYGAEPFRLWCAIEGNLEKTDFRCSFDRIEGASKTLIKLWNVARFVSQFQQKDNYKLNALDEWIIRETNGLIDYAMKHYGSYDFHNPVQKVKHFLWETFASHYLELAKSRAYNAEGNFSEEEQNGAIFTLHWVLQSMLKLLAPVVPFITFKLYDDLYGEDVHFINFPAKQEVEDVNFSTKDVETMNAQVWKAKKDAGVSLRSEVKKIIVPNKLKQLAADIKAAHSAKQTEFDDEFKIEI